MVHSDGVPQILRRKRRVDIGPAQGAGAWADRIDIDLDIDISR